MARDRTHSTFSGTRETFLRESREAYRLLVESVVDYAIFLLDRTGHVQTWNRGAKRLKGYREPEIVGRHFAVFYPDEDRRRGRPERVLEAALRDGRYAEEGWRVRRDGTRFWASVVITALHREGELFGFAKVTRDLTERREAEAERENLLAAEREARRDAEEASRTKSDFLAIVSHELRTPLNAIVGYSDLILDGIPEPVGDGTRRQVERMRSAAEHQLQLVEEILSYSRLEAGDAGLTRERVDLAEVVREAVEQAQPAAAARGLSVRIDTLPGGVEIRTDAAKVRQILGAILSNAVKFTSSGEIRVGLKADGDQGRVCVRDEGVGIAEGDLERIFDSFWQAERPTVREAGGMGLGLTVARRLARLLGGDIEVESERGAGSTFTLRLPLRAPPRAGKGREDGRPAS